MSAFKWFVVLTAAFFALELLLNVGRRARRVREAENKQAAFKKALVGIGGTVFEFTLYVLVVIFMWASSVTCRIGTLAWCASVQGTPVLSPAGGPPRTR